MQLKYRVPAMLAKGEEEWGEELVTNPEMIVFGFFIYSGIIIKGRTQTRSNLSHNTCNQLSEKNYINKTPNQKTPLFISHIAKYTSWLFN